MSFRALAQAFLAVIDRPDDKRRRQRFLDAAAKLDAALIVPDDAGEAGDPGEVPGEPSPSGDPISTEPPRER